MPMKCIDQMPPPMVKAPALAQATRARWVSAISIRPAIESATKAARMAMATDIPTSTQL